MAFTKHELYEAATTAVVADPPSEAEVEKVATAILGTPVTVAKVRAWPGKGLDFRFKEGGLVKFRPKTPEVVVMKLHLPSGARWLGVGPTTAQALAALKPENKAAKEYQPSKPASKKPIRVNGLMMINDAGLSEKEWGKILRVAKLAADLVKRAGFGFILKRPWVYVRRPRHPGVLGNYDMTKKYVELFVAPGAKLDAKRLLYTLIHELGHHYYYSELRWDKHKTFKWYFQQAHRIAKAKGPGGKKEVFPSSYGSTVRYEDFAELFAAYVGRAQKLKPSHLRITRETFERFRSFIRNVDKRVKIRAEGEEPAETATPLSEWTV